MIFKMNSGARERLAVACLCLIAALIVGTTLIIVSRAFTSLPYYDSWRLYPDAVPDFFTLFQGHNEHVIATIRAYFWLDYKLTSSSGLFTAACVLLTCAVPTLGIYLLVQTHGKYLGASSQDDTILGLVLLSLGYAAVQFTNLVWQFQVGFVSAYALSLAALCCQAMSMWTSNRISSRVLFASALALAVLASYGLFGGTLVWPAMLGFAWLARRKVQLGAIVVLGAIVATPYLVNFFSVPVGHGIGDGKVVKFFLAWLGSPAGGMIDTNYLPVYKVPVRLQVGIAAFFGLLTLIAFSWLSLKLLSLLDGRPIERKLLLVMPLWLFCMIVLISALLAAIGRSYLPLNEAISSRYTTPPLIMWACMIGLWLQLRRMESGSPRHFRLAMLAISVAILLSQADRLSQSTLHGALMAKAESAALNDVPDLQALAAIYPTPETIVPHIAQLRNAKVSIFRPDGAPTLGQSVNGLSTGRQFCQVEVSWEPTTYGKTLWRATLNTSMHGGPWNLVYILDQQVAGVGVLQSPRGIHLPQDGNSLWLGYAPNTMSSGIGEFALVSRTSRAVNRCNWGH